MNEHVFCCLDNRKSDRNKYMSLYGCDASIGPFINLTVVDWKETHQTLFLLFFYVATCWYHQMLIIKLILLSVKLERLCLPPKGRGHDAKYTDVLLWLDNVFGLIEYVTNSISKWPHSVLFIFYTSESESYIQTKLCLIEMLLVQQAVVKPRTCFCHCQ